MASPNRTASGVAARNALALERANGGDEYELVAASATAQVLGATGATGDWIGRIIIIPAVVACGAVTLLDGANSIPLFVGGGTTALLDVKPFPVDINLTSVAGAWKITTGANVSVLAKGDFT
jgi:hypothetical protein